MRIRVSGFPPITSKEEIKRIFREMGTVSDVQKWPGKSVAYVTMPYDYQAMKALFALNGSMILGSRIVVEEDC
jgi:RNA recognition motif-containing protein